MPGSRGDDAVIPTLHRTRREQEAAVGSTPAAAALTVSPVAGKVPQQGGPRPWRGAGRGVAAWRLSSACNAAAGSARTWPEQENQRAAEDQGDGVACRTQPASATLQAHPPRRLVAQRLLPLPPGFQPRMLDTDRPCCHAGHV
jgi:hypothetical protein